MSPAILVVDDQESFCRHIQAVLKNENYDVAVANNAEMALSKLSTESYDILLSDMKMPGMNGLELFKTARKIDPNISGIIMTAYGTISSAVVSIKEGLSDYLQKPFEPEVLLMVLEKTLRERKMLQEIRNLRKEIDKRYSFGNIIGKNHKMQSIYSLIQKVAPTEARVFITGETGVGKELVAKAIHFNSPRKTKPFVGVNCGALTETLLEAELFGYERGAFTGAVKSKLGKFEYARGGTLFLDEVGDISPRMQMQLLRVLQEKTFERVGGNRPIDVDVKIISATNQNIRDRISSGDFRVELFYRLNVVPIHIPPLRERIEDIPLLVKHFRDRLHENLNENIQKISARAMGQLMRHPWPGNVRELENVLERAFVTNDGETIDNFYFSHEIPDGEMNLSINDANIDIPFTVARSMVVARFEKSFLSKALRQFNGNVSRTAKKTSINQRTLWRKIKQYGLDTNSGKQRSGA